MTDQMNQQKATMLEKLEARQLLKENKDYEDLAAKTLIKLAKEQHGRAVEGVKKEKGKQSTLVIIKYRNDLTVYEVMSTGV